MPYGWKIEFNGQDITSKVPLFTISAGLESYCREMSLDIADKDFYDSLDFSSISEDPEIEIFTKTETEWISQGKFFVERPELSADIDSDKVRTVWGRSEIAKLGEPFAAKVNKVWEADTTFFAICQEMCTVGGLTWDSSYSEISDFAIFGYTYQAENIYPIEVISQLAQFAGAYVTTDRNGHVCIKQIDYSPSSEDFTVTDADIQSVSESPEWPEFGNRIRITPAGSLAGYSLIMYTPHQCLPADGETEKKVYVRVEDSEGNPVNGVSVSWSTDAVYASLDSGASNTGEILITGEEKRADNKYRVTVDLPPSSVSGIWAYSDTAKDNDFASGGYEISGNEIILTDPLDYCDQSLVIDYYSEGIAVNTIKAGTSAEDITVTADVEGEQDSGDLFIGNPCECPSTIKMTAAPSSIKLNETAKVLAYVEYSGGPETTGKIVYMSEGSKEKKGSLSWTSAKTGKVNISKEKTSVINEISGVSQCEISMYPDSVSSVYQVDEDGNTTGSNIYSSHSGKLINLTKSLPTGTELVVSYTAVGAALNHFTGEKEGTARLYGYIYTQREEPVEDSTTITVGEESPEDWESGDEDGEDSNSSGSGGDSGEWDQSDESTCNGEVCPDGKECCYNAGVLGCFDPGECDKTVMGCLSASLANNPDIDPEKRFAAPLINGCTCEESCEAEFDEYGTTQTYDGSSSRTITEIIEKDHGITYTEGGDNKDYWEKYEELKAEALQTCENDCSSCGGVATLAWSSENPETIGQDVSAAVHVTGGLGPYQWSVSGDGFTLDSSETAGTSNVLNADETACGAAVVTVTDACGQTVVGEVRCTAGQWVLKDEAGCHLSGFSTNCYELIIGNKRQKQDIYEEGSTCTDVKWKQYCGDIDWHALCASNPGILPPCFQCEDMPTSSCKDFSGVGEDRACVKCQGVWAYGEYYEWEC